MAISNTERQRAYRKRMRSEGARVSMMVSPACFAQLERLARHHGITKKDMLEKLTSEAESLLVESMRQNPKKTKEYYGN